MGWLVQEISRASATHRMPVAGLKDFSDLRNVLDSLSRRPGKSDIRASSMPTAKHVIKAGGHGPWIEWQFSFHVKHRDSILPTPGNRNIRPVSRSGPSSRIDHAGKTLPSNGLILSARTRLRLATPRQHSYVDAEICAVCITILSTAPVDNPIARRDIGIRVPLPHQCPPSNPPVLVDDRLETGVDAGTGEEQPWRRHTIVLNWGSIPRSIHRFFDQESSWNMSRYGQENWGYLCEQIGPDP